MKKFAMIVFLVCSAFAYVQCNKEMMDKIIGECQEETEASDADVAELRANHPPKNHEDKCLRACVMKKLAILNDSGKMDTERFSEIAKARSGGNEEQATVMLEIVEACAPIEVSDDHCEASSQYIGCFIQTAKDKGVELDSF